MSEVLSFSSEETFEMGRKLGAKLPPNSVVCLFGDLGAGKTAFVKGIANGAYGIDPLEVHSPTYTYLNVYRGSGELYHFDLYRLNGVDDFIGMGFDEYFDRGGIVCLEWSERIESLIPHDAVNIKISSLGSTKRTISVTHGSLAI